MRRVLMITYRFPPAPGVGGARAFGFAKHLRAYGWDPLVVTTRAGPGEREDTDVARALPEDVTVVRTRPVGRRSGLQQTYRRAASPRPGLSTLLRSVRPLFAPDGLILWWPAAVGAATRLHRRVGFDAVFATGPPFSALVIGRHLKKLTGRPLVSDLRDPWTHQFEHIRKAEAPARRRREHDMERRVIEASDAVLVTSPEFETRLRGTYPFLDDRLTTITNGYDAEEMARVTPRSFERFSIVHTGKLGDGYDPRPFLEAVSRLPDRDAVEIHFVGPVDEAVRRSVETGDVAHLVTVHGWMPHSDALAYQLGADLLLATKDDSDAIAAKLFEYLAAPAPVLGILDPAGSSARLIQRTGMGRVIDPADVPGITRALGDFVRQGRRPERPGGGPPPEYERRHLTAALARVLDRIVPAKNSP